MREIYADVIQFRGSHYDFGFLQGERLRDSLTLHNRRTKWRTMKPRFRIDVREAKSIFTRYAPQLWDELNGMRDALDLPMEEILRDFGGYRTEPVRAGCSVLIGADFMVRNYDFHPNTYEGLYTVFQPDDGGYAIIGPAQRITGRMDGMNGKGLSMGYNFTNRKRPGDGFVCWMVGRLILETCADVEEAVRFLRDLPHRGSFSYNLLDKTGNRALVEAGPRGVIVRDSAYCTNHFEQQTEENRRYLKDSIERMDAMKERPEALTDAEQAWRLLNDTDKGVFADNYKSWAGTIHTSAYFPEKLTAWFALGGDTGPVEFDFGNWLSGEDMDKSTITGHVDTDIGFANMEKLRN
ncbi:C45 family autoproteolytic acyltransferase/hydolase [Bhargavaea beijingensis]|uniref:C45 family autoproteolytic acyltransferase/hydolase n=1 Tax=Bhargavaea beijingensis TaxID=426756 RepID=UPI00222440D0|nr:C45 family peptidase [Bhargavaea beijingensis]MCW1927477.1 C45 family autoproteolytic acyltransferase/hydrolase [Bhargavaea beijingensis]